MKTRDRILEAARTMFNDEAVSQVSTSRIAAELGISPGNLHYHFQTKQQIVEQLFRRFTAAMAPFADADALIKALDDLWLALHLVFEVIERHRFVHRDLEFIVQQYPAMQPRARAMTAGYLEGVRRVCRQLVALEVLQATPDQVEALALQTVLNTTCWPAFAKLALPAGAAASSGAAAYHTLTLLAPYARPPGGAYLDYLRAKYR